MNIRLARMKVAVVTVLAALALASSAHARPNVLLIVTDDQRWDTLEYMPAVSSELVEKGVTFTNAFAVNPLCCPSRASIFTGTWSHTNGVWANRGESIGGFATFDDRFTLPVWLNDVGYATMLAGKYINGYDQRFTPASYVPPGWDSWFAYWGTPAQAYFDYYVAGGAEPIRYGTEPSAYATDVIAAKAVEFIQESGPDPFFLYFAPKAPHWSGSRFNVDPAPRHIGKVEVSWSAPPSVNEADVSDKPRYIRRRRPVDPARVAEFREEQLESLLAVDEAIAAMLAALEDRGKLANTLIVFTSDNGYAWGEHRWPQKTAPYEESIRVPLVVRYDALGIPVRRERRLALNVDLASTITHAAGVHVGTLEGRSLLPLLDGGLMGWRRSVLIEHANDRGVVPSYCGFRGLRWKYVQYGTGEEELYDLRSDPFELRNLRAPDRRRPLIMRHRARVQRSACRPPWFRALPLCTRTGTHGPDRIRGTRKRDWICAGRGNDRIRVRWGGRDVVRCRSGFDRVHADVQDVLIGCERRSRKRIPPPP